MTIGHGYIYELFRRIGLSDFGARTATFLVVRPFRIGLILLAALFFARFLSRAAAEGVRSLHRRATARRESERGALRTATMAAGLASLVRVVVWVIATLLVLNELGINLAPLLAGAGVVGVALAFGAQSLVRDMLAGLFIIGEDQYGVGDTVDLGSASGVVEEVSLRATRLRGGDGTVWWVPNGQIQRVGNATMEYSKAVVDIPLPYGSDLDAVAAAMGEECAAVCADPAWAPVVLAPPEAPGLQTLDASGVVMRVVVTTKVGQQYALGRELRRRILERLTREGLRPLAATPPPPPLR